MDELPTLEIKMAGFHLLHHSEHGALMVVGGGEEEGGWRLYLHFFVEEMK